MQEAMQHVTVALGSGLATACLTTVIAPALRRRWKTQDVSTSQIATVEVARIDASEKFQDRLMARIEQLEAQGANTIGLCESVAKLAASVERLATVIGSRAGASGETR